jgi:hypothetical protein
MSSWGDEDDAVDFSVAPKFEQPIEPVVTKPVVTKPVVTKPVAPKPINRSWSSVVAPNAVQKPIQKPIQKPTPVPAPAPIQPVTNFGLIFHGRDVHKISVGQIAHGAVSPTPIRPVFANGQLKIHDNQIITFKLLDDATPAQQKWFAGFQAESKYMTQSGWVSGNTSPRWLYPDAGQRLLYRCKILFCCDANNAVCSLSEADLIRYGTAQ